MTPLSDSRGTPSPVAIVLGGTVPHRALIQNLQRRGYFTVLIDYLESPPASTVADRHVRHSALDKEAVLNCAVALNASLVISTCVDQANLVACAVAASLKLPAPYSLDTAKLVTNKGLMKRRLVASGIPTARFVTGASWQDFERHQLQYPVVVKPIDSNGSKGVVKVDDRSQLRAPTEAALSMSRSNRALIEEWVPGREVAIDSYILDGHAHLLLSRERRRIRDLQAGTDVQQITGSVWPAQLDAEVLTEFESLATRIASAFDLNNTPLMIQAIVHENTLHVIEFAPRIGGGENYRIIPFATGADIIDYSVDSWLGQQPELAYSPPTQIVADLYIYADPCEFGQLLGISDLVDRGVALYGEVYKREGEAITAELTSNQRVGAIVVAGSSEEDVLHRIRVASRIIRVLDTSGRDVMRTDIYADSP